jgi:hypothetical protein
MKGKTLTPELHCPQGKGEIIRCPLKRVLCVRNLKETVTECSPQSLAWCEMYARNSALPFLALLGFEFRALSFLGRHSTAWAMSPVLSALVVLEIGSCSLPRPTWTRILLFYASFHLWTTVFTTVPSFFLPWDWSLENFFFFFFCLGWPGIAILLMSAPRPSLEWQAHIAVLSYWLGWGLVNSLPGLALNHDPSNLSLSSS